MVIRELIVDIDDEAGRVVWSAVGATLQHHNASAQVFANTDGGSKVVWQADILPHDAAGRIAAMMEQGMAVMKTTLDQLAQSVSSD
jgi:hypothetical protein